MRWRLPVLVLTSACVVGTGAWWWITDPGTHEDTEGLDVDEDGRPLDQREAAARERRELQARARNMASHEREPGDAATVPYGTGQIDRATAEAGFDDVMTEVETFAKSRERIHREEWDTLYRTANDAFAALSVHLDANEPSDRQSLEDAHRRLQEGLRRVRVRGRKFSDI